MFLDDVNELGLETLMAILLCLFILWLCYRLQQKKTRKTFAHIDFMLDRESDANEVKQIDPPYIQQ